MNTICRLTSRYKKHIISDVNMNIAQNVRNKRRHGQVLSGSGRLSCLCRPAFRKFNAFLKLIFINFHLTMETETELCQFDISYTYIWTLSLGILDRNLRLFTFSPTISYYVQNYLKIMKLKFPKNVLDTSASSSIQRRYPDTEISLELFVLQYVVDVVHVPTWWNKKQKSLEVKTFWLVNFPVIQMERRWWDHATCKRCKFETFQLDESKIKFVTNICFWVFDCWCFLFNKN